jgi:TolB-like 6-blade propeller-like
MVPSCSATSPIADPHARFGVCGFAGSGFRSSRAASLLSSAILAAALAACGSEAPERRPRAAHADAPIIPASAAPEAAAFSGRVPRLGPGEQPRDTLRVVRLLGDSLAFASVAAIERVGERLLVADAMMSRHLALVDLATGAVGARAGGHGQGPGEFQDPASFIIESETPLRALAYDFQNRRMSRVTATAAGGLEVGESTRMDLGESLERPVRVGTRLVANGLFPDYTLLVMDPAGRPLQRIAADPPFPARTVPNVVARRLLNRSYLDAAPSGGRLALAYQWASRIDVFNGDGRRVGSIRGPRATAAKYRIQDNRFFWDPRGEMAYTAVRTTDRFVYALFCGCREADDPDQRSRRLHVFRWNGDFVAEVQLDRRVTAFTVAGDDSVLYAFVTEPYPAVGEWRLAPVLANAVGGSGGAAER